MARRRRRLGRRPKSHRGSRRCRRRAAAVEGSQPSSGPGRSAQREKGRPGDPNSTGPSGRTPRGDVTRRTPPSCSRPRPVAKMPARLCNRSPEPSRAAEGCGHGEEQGQHLPILVSATLALWTPFLVVKLQRLMHSLRGPTFGTIPSFARNRCCPRRYDRVEVLALDREPPSSRSATTG
jgi:hypothetical protein